jgi:thymidine phosphorylase
MVERISMTRKYLLPLIAAIGLAVAIIASVRGIGTLKKVPIEKLD